MSHREAYQDYEAMFSHRRRQVLTLAQVEAAPACFACREPWLPPAARAIASPEGAITPPPVRILDLGCGWGGDLLSFWAAGHRDLTGVDIGADLIDTARRATQDKIAFHCADVFVFLKERSESWDLITCLDVIEHLTKTEAVDLLRLVKPRLAPGGHLVLRTPNMACIFASFTRYADITHECGYTEDSLFQLAHLAGFARSEVVVEPLRFDLCAWRPWAPWRGFRAAARLHRFMHRLVYRYFLRTSVPCCHTRNVTVLLSDFGDTAP